MRKSLYRLLVSIFVMYPAFPALGGEVCVKDDLAREVCLPGVAGRVISLAPSLTEIVFALGAGANLVGRTARCDYPPEVSGKVNVGPYLKPDLERIISLNPDLVLTRTTSSRKEFVARLEGLGIPVFVSDCRSVGDVFSLTKRVGRLLGKDRRAAELVDELVQRRKALHSRLTGKRSPSVLLVIGTRPLVVSGGKSFIGAMIREVGGDNIAEKAFIPFPKYSAEEIAIKDPELIIVLDKECADGVGCEQEMMRFGDLSAVRNRKIFTVDANKMARPSLRIIDSLERLAEIIH
jgi:ABC-type Fe3+-hydroxamate transport system substrate-binding protein